MFIPGMTQYKFVQIFSPAAVFSLMLAGWAYAGPFSGAIFNYLIILGIANYEYSKDSQ